MQKIDLKNKVAIITGAGAGIGRCHALELAKYGANIVVNDINQENANAVCDEIIANNGQAIAISASVNSQVEMNKLVEETMKKWGRIDILVNNAGVLRDVSFSKMTIDDFDLVFDIHVRGAFIATKAVWEIMKTQNFGRIIFTTSSSGLYGNFGQSNYGAAKLALVGFMNTLKIEGAKNNIRVNCLSPVASTAMTINLLPPEFITKLAPEFISPAIVFLSTDEAPNGIILSAGAGGFAIVKIIETNGKNLIEIGVSAENIQANFDEINDDNKALAYQQGHEQTQKFLYLSS